MVSDNAENKPSGDQPIPRAYKIEIVIVGVVFLLALISAPLMWLCAEKNAADDHEKELMRTAKVKVIHDEQIRKPEKSEEQKLSDECGRLAIERVHSKSGGKDLLDFYIWRKSIHAQYEGFADFVANFDVGTLQIPDPSERIKETASRRKELHGRYIRAKRALADVVGQSSSKDEFETEEEHKARIKNKDQVIKELENKCDKVLDEIVVLEKTCNTELLRSSINGFYTLNEALIFIPISDWNYEAEKGQFNVRGRVIKDPNGSYWHDNDAETVQAFHFFLNGIRASQFVKSNAIKCKYKIANGVWDHPRKFKEYKTKHPFLLVRLEMCDMKVQGTTDRVMTMPWYHVSEKEEAARARLAYYQDQDNCYKISILHDQVKSIWREIESEAQKKCKSIFNVHTCEGYNAAEALPIAEVFADNRTVEGRAEIENALKHFESIGGAYYREFCKAVRLELTKASD